MRRLLTALACAAGLGLTALAVTGPGASAPADAATRTLPGSFTGYAFDACQAPSQRAMDRWLTRSPYWGVGIYTSGTNRYCAEQEHLDARWVAEQDRKGWVLLPIHVGRQASCTTVDRWRKISAKRADDYAAARKQGRAEAREAVGAAKRYGIGRRSTLWYDLESFDISRTRCRESALALVSAWTRTLHGLGYRSGFYSSASTGITMLERARTGGSGRTLPDQVWVAEWNGRATTRTGALAPEAWAGDRVHQYRGGHDETHGGVTINIDSNYMAVGGGSSAPPPRGTCGVRVDFARYPALRRGDRDPRVRAAQCLLRRQGHLDGPLSDRFTRATQRAVAAFQSGRPGLRADGDLDRRTWTALLAHGGSTLLKFGSASDDVRRLQRALNAAGPARLAVDGVFGPATRTAVRGYQARVGGPRSGVVSDRLWQRLQAGER